MGPSDLFPFPADPPNAPRRRVAPLDDTTADRLLTGRLDPDDAPPGYAEVASLLQAVSAPAQPDELTGQAAALAAFRAARRPPARRRPARRPSAPRRPARPRDRLVAVALAGALAVGGAWVAGGLWTAEGISPAGWLRSPTGGPGAGGSGFGASGSGGSGSAGTGAAGSLALARPDAAPVTGGSPPVLPSARERAIARHGRGVAARHGGSARGLRQAQPPKPPSSKASKAEGSKPKASKRKASKAEAPTGKASRAAEDGAGKGDGRRPEGR